MIIKNIKISENIDPFYIEGKIIDIQRKWRYNKYHKYKYDIVKNKDIIGNYQDPISLNPIFVRNKIINIENLFPIFKKDRLYIYELSSLKEILEYNLNEIYSDEKFSKNELSNIKFLLKTRKSKNENIRLTKDEKLHFRKMEIFQIFYEVETYFTLSIYESINKNFLMTIFNELKLMWNSYKQDYQINEKQLFGKVINWNLNMLNIEEHLLKNIDIMINNDLDKLFKKNICYLIIGAFCYVDKDLKKFYENIDFI